MHNRWLFMAILVTGSLFFMANMAPPGWADPPRGGNRGTVPKEVRNPQILESPSVPKPKFICPPGWEKAEEEKGTKYLCKPKKPMPMNCPTGWHYEHDDHAQCKAGGFGGHNISGCRVGCYKDIEKPK